MTSGTLRTLLFPVKLHYLRVSNVFYSTSSLYQENKIKVGKYNINYLKVGQGEHSVLCMPGVLGSIWTDFKPQVEEFDRDKFNLVIWEAPGCGKSRPPEREFHTDYYAQDVDIAVDFMKTLNIPKFSVLGWSYGGAASMVLAAKHSDVVEKLVIWGTSTNILPQEIETYKKMKDIRTWSEKKRQPMLELYGEERLSILWTGAVDAMVNVINAKEGVTDIRTIIKDIKCPTYILYGEKDPLVDKSHVSFIHRSIPNSRVHLYPEGRHDIHIKYKKDFNQRVQDFLLTS